MVGRRDTDHVDLDLDLDTERPTYYTSVKQAINRYLALMERLYGSKAIPISPDIIQCAPSSADDLKAELADLDRIIESVPLMQMAALLASFHFDPLAITRLPAFEGLDRKAVVSLIRRGTHAMRVALYEAGMMV